MTVSQRDISSMKGEQTSVARCVRITIYISQRKQPNILNEEVSITLTAEGRLVRADEIPAMLWIL